LTALSENSRRTFLDVIIDYSLNVILNVEEMGNVPLSDFGEFPYFWTCHRPND